MAASDGSASPEPMETTEAPATAEDSNVTSDQGRAMKSITDKIYKHKEKDGHEPSKLFQRKVNKRVLPDYYDVIKEPVALSTLRAKLLHKSYTSFSEYVRDAALIVHNAQTYNRPNSGAFQDSMVLKRLFEEEFKKLVEQNIVTEEESKFPDLGELPPIEDLPLLPEEEEEEEDEDEEDEDEEEEAEDSDEEGGRRRKKRGPRSTAAISKREGGARADGIQADSRKRRGRPPKVDTPMESRIKNILKGIRRVKSDNGRLLYLSFEKLPDKTEHPHYYLEIKEPLAIEQIKRKQKRKKYNSVDHFMRDMDTMFNNCKSYNETDSSLYKDAEVLQTESHRLAVEEKAKPDADFAMDEGRLPLPDGIHYNAELWKVGDWVHLQNPNDVTKPIVAQIYRTWQDNDGEKWINACWYYRPEQTVHHYEKFFFPGEVVKTGQYRDHRAEEIVDRCFVMFITRYSRGRPRGFPSNKEVYVCESRYNEEKHKMNKIKTWASCLPDEVRDRDYEMDIFDRPKKIKKVPSPLLYLLKDDEKESTKAPKPRWGAENAPPLVGAVYKGPRDENQTPPPEPTPSPPPQPPPSSAKPVKMTFQETPNYRNDVIMDGVERSTASTIPHAGQSYSSSHQGHFPQQTASPAPIHHPHQYTQQAPNTYTQPLDHYATPPAKYPQPQGGTYPRPPEVFRLPDTANSLIPEEIRDQFQQDDQGHLLFFAAPPLDILPPVKAGSVLSHSAKYLAAKLRDKIAEAKKRKVAGATQNGESVDSNDIRNDGEPTHDAAQPITKKPKRETSTDREEIIDGVLLEQKIAKTQHDAMQLWIQQMRNSTDRIYQDLYGEHWQEGKKIEEEKLAAAQRLQRARNETLQKHRQLRAEREKVSLVGDGIFKDDYDQRY